MDAKTISTAAVFGALWGVINFTLSPYIFRLTHLPIFCDVVGFLTIFSALWLTRKLGTGTLTGISATIVTLALRPAAFYFFGFTAASIVVDLLVYAIGHERFYGKKSSIHVIAVGTVAATVAGLIIGQFFMNFKVFTQVLTWTALHAVGGLIGSIIAIPVIKGLEARLKEKA